MNYKILCPFHNEKTPSCTVYPETDSYFCFGCGATGKLKNIEKEYKPSSKFGTTAFSPASREKIYKDILNKPKKVIRGLELSYDDSGYYIVYPNMHYWVYRRFDTKHGSKYSYPTGVQKQMFKALTGVVKPSTLVIVEGQLNALSLAKAVEGTNTPFDIISPGSATDISSVRTIEYVCSNNFKHCAIFVDFDKAGVENGLKLAKELTLKGVNCLLYPLKKDFNDLLVEYGKEELWKESSRALEMLRMQSRDKSTMPASGGTAT